jgi:hypothetical protein
VIGHLFASCLFSHVARWFLSSSSFPNAPCALCVASRCHAHVVWFFFPVMPPCGCYANVSITPCSQYMLSIVVDHSNACPLRSDIEHVQARTRPRVSSQSLTGSHNSYLMTTSARCHCSESDIVRPELWLFFSPCARHERGPPTNETPED